jgi:hypothetical protein
MNKRNACFAGLAVVVTLLAGCAAQLRNTSTCEEEMRNRLATQTLGELKVTHTATTYRGARVVIEGQLDHVPLPASEAAVASAASGAKAAQSSQAASASMQTSSSKAASASQASELTAPSATAAMVPGMMAVPTAPAANATGGAVPTTPMAELAAKLGISKKPLTQAAAECTFNESGLATFRWLAPAALAKTTPDPNAGND